jgi:hypothetical protein
MIEEREQRMSNMFRCMTDGTVVNEDELAVFVNNTIPWVKVTVEGTYSEQECAVYAEKLQ